MIREISVKPEETSNRTKICVENIKQWLKKDDHHADKYVAIHIDDGSIHSGSMVIHISKAGSLQLINALVKAITEEENYAE